ncbi:HYC_CC_PP family protein [Polaribacter sp.]|uniref:HYC_CC_PP family protein n=1 Tax=Polaribacter sp. TaxID=1920175 RepID=UPI003EF2EC9C
MKQVFSKIASILLALLVLFSTFSFTVEKHYCGDFLMDVSFVGDADDCGMEMQKIATKKNCCKDEIHKVEGQDKLQTNKIEKITFAKKQFLTAFVIAYTDLCIIKESDIYFYPDFSPPEVSSDYRVLYQTFLI